MYIVVSTQILADSPAEVSVIPFGSYQEALDFTAGQQDLFADTVKVFDRNINADNDTIHSWCESGSQFITHIHKIK